jgi:hypothetical protein
MTITVNTADDSSILQVIMPEISVIGNPTQTSDGLYYDHDRIADAQKSY